MDKKKTHHNKKVKASASYDSLDSVSLAPQPHLPSSVYNPNPFPLDPAQPDGVSRHNAFYSHRARETRETESLDIEIEETRGFMSGKSRQSIDQGNMQSHRKDGDNDMEYDVTRKTNTIQRLGAGLKGVLAKSGLARSKDKEGEKQVKEVDAVLQHHLQQRDQEERERQHGDRDRLYSDTTQGEEDYTSPRNSRPKQDPFSNRRARLHSLSPPPLPRQDRRNSITYWPEGRAQTQQMVPFIGYQPPPPASPHRHRPQDQQHNRPSRPLSQAIDSDFGLSRHSVEDPCRPRERDESDRARREALGESGGARRQSGLNQVMSADSVVRIPSEFGDDEESVSASLDGSRSRQIPDRLSRAKEWVANHSRNNGPTVPAPVINREAILSSFPGVHSARSSRRVSVDGYGFATPRGGYDSRERMVRMNHAEVHGFQRGYRNSMADDGAYWRRQLEGYEHCQYRQSREDCDYSLRGGFYGYTPGGPDDVDNDGAESTIAPGSVTGGSQSKKSLESPDAAKKTGADADPTVVVPADEEADPLASPKVPNKRRLILRLVILPASLLVLVLLIAAAPTGLAFHYIVAILSMLVSIAFVFNYFSRRLRRKPKMKRYIMLGLDIVMALMWFIDIFICISKFPCAVGGQNG
ncbi:hypothetical protein BGZ65_001688, partial [Modicella reniformis]